MTAIIPIQMAAASATQDELVALLRDALQSLVQQQIAFRQVPPTPLRTCAFEKK